DADAATLTLAGEALAGLGEFDQARAVWNRALFALPASARTARRELLVRLARVEDDHGEPAVALRLWQSVLELEPGLPEARRRIQDLSGFH
ncbi:MAG TPA: hypothetical protein VJS92_12235, partial [Candidatus Polarisedimenticolaceae bacterium]|nr:hypothetical protein [Candidatus Polarisedimenticolaceae bacterium]